MSWFSIERRFREAGVPLRLGDRSWFAVDVDRSEGSRREWITLSPGDAEVHVMDSDRDVRQLLLQVRSGPDWSGRPVPVRKVLVGHDERQLFVVDVPSWRRAVNTVALAHEALKPEPVRRAGRGVVRQGEWFFVPAPWVTGDWGGVRKRVRLGGRNPHVIAELLGDPWQIGRGASSGWGRYRETPVFARGFVRHREHKPLNLRGWHRIYGNTANPVTGNYED